MMRRLVLVLACVVFSSGSAFAQSVFLVRHAERADTASGIAPTMDTDPDLSEAGHRRAEALAKVLKDARITAIFVTQYKRTHQTAAPLAKALGLTPIVINSKDTPALVAKLRSLKENALVVGHSNSVPNVIAGLGVTPTPVVADDEFDNLFIVHSPGQMIRLRFP